MKYLSHIYARWKCWNCRLEVADTPFRIYRLPQWTVPTYDSSKWEFIEYCHQLWANMKCCANSKLTLVHVKLIDDKQFQHPMSVSYARCRDFQRVIGSRTSRLFKMIFRNIFFAHQRVSADAERSDCLRSRRQTTTNHE